jgi:hypothetical protein
MKKYFLIFFISLIPLFSFAQTLNLFNNLSDTDKKALSKVSTSTLKKLKTLSEILQGMNLKKNQSINPNNINPEVCYPSSSSYNQQACTKLQQQIQNTPNNFAQPPFNMQPPQVPQVPTPQAQPSQNSGGGQQSSGQGQQQQGGQQGNNSGSKDCGKGGAEIDDGAFKQAVKASGIKIRAGNYGGELADSPLMLKQLKDECKCDVELTSGVRRPSGTHGRGGRWFDMAPTASLSNFITSKGEPSGNCRYKWKGISFLDERNCYFSAERTGPHWHVDGRNWECGK